MIVVLIPVMVGPIAMGTIMKTSQFWGLETFIWICQISSPVINDGSNLIWNMADLKDLIAATGLVISLNLD